MVLPFGVVQGEDIITHFISYKSQARHTRYISAGYIVASNLEDLSQS